MRVELIVFNPRVGQVLFQFPQPRNCVLSYRNQLKTESQREVSGPGLSARTMTALTC